MKKIQNVVCAALICVFALVWFFSKDVSVTVPASADAGENVNKKVIVLDAGHGGIDGGCVSVNGVAEKGINLSIVQTLRDCFDILGFDVVCTREDDRSIHDSGVEGIGKQKLSDMKNRLDIINRYDDALVLSVHQNQFVDERYSGAQMFYAKDNDDSRRLAECMKKQFVALLQPNNERETKPVGKEIYLIHNAKSPSVLVECGFLSNHDEAKLLESADYQKKVAFTILTGAQEYLLTMPKE
ncbi:N-acetylmuramoyl-L-alanine amidase [Ruminococcus sp.]|uniref:N-acetylmuramoyl-L-alanine amidase n=1 Tax=Ruminococcus sp. TaxID=41978 RepID=UPI001B0F28FB|nr:N-acetylmuramoyl-L-alanine amidase [Ruminococcus sp.]MBO5559333.1 N-acetylmuramoyl-L-alanine amidase [Ruminococcus sp.]MBP1536937.1 N-acetylmuramoyl-L-alanine amidase [Ruminococcus sp.]MBQ9868804.1 N-acetylmuramoyl-L-alanine amidase [Ruminococcus sp.]